jgi:hypothetical protein
MSALKKTRKDARSRSDPAGKRLVNDAKRKEYERFIPGPDIFYG